jgi:hypothetical protein
LLGSLPVCQSTESNSDRENQREIQSTQGSRKAVKRETRMEMCSRRKQKMVFPITQAFSSLDPKIDTFSLKWDISILKCAPTTISINS